MHNVERLFPVVGVLEDLEETLTVMEVEMPEYFGGLHELYRNLTGTVLIGIHSPPSSISIIYFQLLKVA